MTSTTDTSALRDLPDFIRDQVCCPRVHGCEVNGADECPAERVRALLAERDALAGEVERLKERNVEVAARAYRWMVAHDKLKAGQPYDYPNPADVPNAEARAREAEAKVQALTEGLKIAVAHARKMKNAPKLVGPREAENDPRLHRLWGRWMYTEGKALWDDLKEARALLHPTPSEHGGERG